MIEQKEQPDRIDRDPGAPQADEEIARDLRAMQTTSTHGLPALASAARSARRRSTPVTWREHIVFTIHKTFVQRPWPVIGVVVAVLLAVFIPISFERTTGSDVTLTLGRPGLGADQVAAVAKQVKTVLGADRVTIQNVSGESAGPTLRAFIPGAGAGTAALAQALANGLTAQGYAAAAVTTPRRERVSSPLLAYAMQQVIEIRTDGKSAAELEAEIRQRFAEAGIPDARVSVTDEGGHRKIGVEVERQMIGDPSTGPLPETPQIVLTKDGVPLGANGFTVKVRKKKDNAATTLSVEVQDEGRTAVADVPGADMKSDAEIASSIESQLRQSGLNVRVRVTDGRVNVEKQE